MKYRPGRKNIDADLLSRRPHTSLSPDVEWPEIPPGVRAFCQGVSVGKRENSSLYPCIRQVEAQASAVPHTYCQTAAVKSEQFPSFNSSDLQVAQKSDPCIGEVWLAVLQAKPACSLLSDHPDIKVLKREWEKLKIDHGLLHRIITLSDQRVQRQLKLPRQFHNIAFKLLHDQNRHLEFEKTYALVRDRFFWPRMKLDVEKYCKSCERCIKSKTLLQRAAPLSHMHSSGPLDLVCIDFLTIEPDSRNVCNVLVITDHFTRYAQAIPTRDSSIANSSENIVGKVLYSLWSPHTHTLRSWERF